MKRTPKIILWIIIIGVLLGALALITREKEAKPEEAVNNTLPLIENKEEILGNKDDLISFTIWPNTSVHGLVSYRGVIQGGYFFEGNILIRVLDLEQNVLKASNAMATSEWMTSGPVNFEGNIDFSDLPIGQAYLEIHNDNASGLPEFDKNILIPIVIE